MAKLEKRYRWTRSPTTCAKDIGRLRARGRESLLNFYDYEPRSRLLLGTAQYPSLDIMSEAIKAAEADIVTVSLRRAAALANPGQEFAARLRSLGVRVLPNTAGCTTSREAVTTAHMAREVYETPWIKLEVTGTDATLPPDVFELVEAARILCEDGFEVFPYTTEDLVVAERLVDVGCRVLMPWAAPIGSGRGLNNPYGLRSLRAHFAEVALVVDAGVGLPSHAAAAMELGYDAVLLNTAVAEAGDPVTMARAFAHAVKGGRMAYAAHPMAMRSKAAASTPSVGQPILA